MLCTKFQQFQALFDVKILASCLIAYVLAIEFYNLNNNNNNNNNNANIISYRITYQFW